MLKRIFSLLTSGATIILLVFGLVRAATNHYAERSAAIQAQCQADRQRLGLDENKLRERYPTPEIKFCRLVRVAPGGTGEIVVRGTFQAGTKFLFDTDKVEIVKEALKEGPKESEYRATVKVSQGSLPDYAFLISFQPVMCRTTNCEAVYIGGRYEYSFTADNGWRITLKFVSEPPGDQRELISLYRAEFYRPQESQPFETREARLGCHREDCNAAFGEGAEIEQLRQKMVSSYSNRSPQEQEQSNARVKELRAEWAKWQVKMKDFAKMSPQERKDVMAKIQELSKQMSEAMTPQGAREARQEIEKKEKEFGCHHLNFELKGDALEGSMACGELVGRRGRLSLKGATKFLGP